MIFTHINFFIVYKKWPFCCWNVDFELFNNLNCFQILIWCLKVQNNKSSLIFTNISFLLPSGCLFCCGNRDFELILFNNLKSILSIAFKFYYYVWDDKIKVKNFILIGKFFHFTKKLLKNLTAYNVFWHNGT